MDSGSKNISGRRIAEARKRNKPKITQLELSRLLISGGVQLDRAAVAKIEIGLRGVLDFELLAFSRLLDVSLDTLLSGGPAIAVETPPPPPLAEYEEPAPDLPETPERDNNRALVFL